MKPRPVTPAAEDDATIIAELREQNELLNAENRTINDRYMRMLKERTERQRQDEKVNVERAALLVQRYLRHVFVHQGLPVLPVLDRVPYRLEQGTAPDALDVRLAREEIAAGRATTAREADSMERLLEELRRDAEISRGEYQSLPRQARRLVGRRMNRPVAAYSALTIALAALAVACFRDAYKSIRAYLEIAS